MIFAFCVSTVSEGGDGRFTHLSAICCRVALFRSGADWSFPAIKFSGSQHKEQAIYKHTCEPEILIFCPRERQSALEDSGWQAQLADARVSGVMIEVLTSIDAPIPII